MKDSMQVEINNLKKEIDRLKKSVKEKKFGLVWMDVPEKFDEESENKLPILKEIPEKAVINNDDNPTHILIEGDNYHALTCLNYTHKGKIDVIYIDPPYNTGAKDWKYNNNYVEENDPWRHSKWINFMSNRLHLAKRLLKKDGVLICTIDENEHAALGMLLSEIFSEYDITCVTIIHNPAGVQGNNFSYVHEYAYFIYPKGGTYIGKTIRSDDLVSPLRDWGTISKREQAKNCFYSIKIKDNKIVSFGKVCDADFHPQKANIFLKNGLIEIYPIDKHGIERKWVFSRNSIEKIKDQLSVKKINGEFVIIRTKQEANYRTVWDDKRYYANIYGSKLLNNLINVKFPFPKSLYAVEDCIKATIHNKDNAIILDFFAGSGTTGHAVLELNKQDSGQRQFILCTNNEGNICEEVCYPRIKKVLNDYSSNGKNSELLYEKKITVTSFKKANDILAEIEFIKLEKEKHFDKFETDIEDNHIKLFGVKDIKDKKEGLGGSLKYYKTAFIGKNNILKATDEDKIELAHQAGDLLALAENTLYKVKENKFWQLYKNGERYTAVYFREELDKFDEFVEMVEKLKCSVTVYIFSWGDEEFAEEFEHIAGVKVKTIPLPILEIYKNIYNVG